MKNKSTFPYHRDTESQRKMLFVDGETVSLRNFGI